MSKQDLTSRSSFWRGRAGLLLLVVLVFLPGALAVGSGVSGSASLLALDALMVPLAWGALRLRGDTWKTVGLSAHIEIRHTLGIAVGATVVLVGATYVLRPMVYSMTGTGPNLEAFEVIRGNLPALLGGLVAVLNASQSLI